MKKYLMKRYLLITAGVMLCLAAAILGSVSVSVRPGYIADDKRATQQAIDQFHQRLSDEQYDAIYRDAYEGFWQSRSREDLIAAMRETRNRYGRVSEVTYSTLNVLVGATVQIRAVYNTTFEKSKATELFVFVKQGDDVRLAMYQIFPGTVQPSDAQ